MKPTGKIGRVFMDYTSCLKVAYMDKYGYHGHGVRAI